MQTPDDQPTRRDHTSYAALALAQLSCLAFGLGLMAWAITPLLIQRLVGRQPPQARTLAMSAIALLLGLAYLGLGLLIRRKVRWAIQACVGVSLSLLVIIAAPFLLGKVRELPAFSTLLAASTMLTGWLALGTQPGRRPVDLDQDAQPVDPRQSPLPPSAPPG